jgi:hypothetical protein
VNHRVRRQQRLVVLTRDEFDHLAALPGRARNQPSWLHVVPAVDYHAITNGQRRRIHHPGPQSGECIGRAITADLITFGIARSAQIVRSD